MFTRTYLAKVNVLINLSLFYVQQTEDSDTYLYFAWLTE